MTNKMLHQNTLIVISHGIYKRKASQARSDYLAASVAAARRSIYEAILACGNRFKVHR